MTIFIQAVLTIAVFDIVVSSTKRNKWISSEEYLIRCFKTKASSRSVIQFVHNSVRIFLSQIRKVHSLWEVLPYEPSVFSQDPLSHEW